MNLGEKPADPVADLSDLPRQVQIESGKHGQRGFVYVRDLDAAQCVRHAAGRVSDDEGIFSSVEAVPGCMSAMRRMVSPGKVGHSDAQMLSYSHGQGTNGRGLTDN
ncbi:hypothetical protein D3C74_461360 [compost metagenome]